MEGDGCGLFQGQLPETKESITSRTITWNKRVLNFDEISMNTPRTQRHVWYNKKCRWEIACENLTPLQRLKIASSEFCVGLIGRISSPGSIHMPVVFSFLAIQSPRFIASLFPFPRGGTRKHSSPFQGTIHHIGYAKFHLYLDIHKYGSMY